MNAAAILAQLRTAGAAAARGARDHGVAAVAEAAAALPGVTAERSDAGVMLHGKGLIARAFGSRGRAADARFAALLAAISGGRR